MTAQQTQIDFARKARDKGISKAIRHADAVHDSWSDKAFGHFRTFVAQQTGPFKIESFREWVKDFLPSPPSLRAFGSITVRAVRVGLIRRIGYTQVTNIKAHRANCALWRRA